MEAYSEAKAKLRGYNPKFVAHARRRRAERTAAVNDQRKILELQVRIEELKLKQIEISARSRLSVPEVVQRRPLSALSEADRVIQRICMAFRIKRKELLSNRRQREITLARHAAYYWIYRLTPLSLPQIGRKLHKDHTTILHGIRKYPSKRASMGRHLRVLPGGRKESAS